MNLNDWREPTTKAFSCEYKPGDYSCDNGVLFSAEACMLGLVDEQDLLSIAIPYELSPGVFKRYPTSNDLCSWDDHFGASIASETMAIDVLDYLESHSWTLPNGNWIGRMPILKPAVKAGAGLSLNLWDQLKVCAVYFYNSFEKREETSGKMLLFFGRRVFQNNWLTREVTTYWSKKMAKLYIDPSHMFNIYFPNKSEEIHPFVLAAPDEWLM